MTSGNTRIILCFCSGATVLPISMWMAICACIRYAFSHVAFNDTNKRTTMLLVWLLCTLNFLFLIPCLLGASIFSLHLLSDIKVKLDRDGLCTAGGSNVTSSPTTTPLVVGDRRNSSILLTNELLFANFSSYADENLTLITNIPTLHCIMHLTRVFVAVMLV